MQCVAVWYSVLHCVTVLQCVAVCRKYDSILCETYVWLHDTYSYVLQSVAGCCRVLQDAALCCSVLCCVAVCCSLLQCVALCRNVLQCSVTSFSVL